MNLEDFNTAKSLQEDIKQIKHILRGLKDNSFYKLALNCAGSDRTGELDELLGKDYMSESEDKLIKDLTLRQYELEYQFTNILNGESNGTKTSI